MNFIKSDIFEKVLAIIAFSFIILSLIIIVNTQPASFYEISIYDAFPWYFWFFMLAAIFIGQLIVFRDIFYGSLEKKYEGWILGLTAILIPIIILVFLPIIRGYPTYGRGDHLTHIGIVKDILQYGYIGQNNFYPNLHLLTASSTLVTGDSLIKIINFISRFFFFLSVISMYLFFRIIFSKKNEKNEMKFALILSSTFLFFGSFCNYLAPYNQNLLLIPIILYLYFRRGTLKNTILFSLLLLIILISFIFYHPLNSLLLILIFLFIAFSFYLSPKSRNVNIIEMSEKHLKEKSLNIALLSILIFFTWYFSFSSIVGSFYHVFSSIFYSTGESFFESQITSFVSYSPTIFDSIKEIVSTYGLSLLVGFLSILSIIYNFIKWQRNKQSYNLRFCIIFSGIIFLIFIILTALAFFADFIVGWGRFILWTRIFSFILISSIFYSVISNYKNENIPIKLTKKFVTITSISIFLIFLTFLSLFTFHPAPINGSANMQVTSMEWEGMTWIMENGNKQILIDELGITQWRFSSAIFGVIESDAMNLLGHISRQPPVHFSYHNETSLGESYNKSRYIIISRFAKIFYPATYPNYMDQWRFTPDDFNQLQNDTAVIRFYDNSGFEAYLVRPYTYIIGKSP